MMLLRTAHWDSLHLSNSKSSKEEKGEWTRQSSGGETVDVRVVMRRASGHARAEVRSSRCLFMVCIVQLIYYAILHFVLSYDCFSFL